MACRNPGFSCLVLPQGSLHRVFAINDIGDRFELAGGHGKVIIDRTQRE